MENPEDRVFRICVAQANQSPCAGLMSGAVITDDRCFFTIADHTRPPEPLTGLCAASCPGRQESSGPCTSAEEWVVWRAIHNGIKLNRHYLYIVDADRSGPVPRQRPYFTNLRSALTIWHAQVRRISVFGRDEHGRDRWIHLSAHDCLVMARERWYPPETSAPPTRTE